MRGWKKNPPRRAHLAGELIIANQELERTNKELKTTQMQLARSEEMAPLGLVAGIASAAPEVTGRDGKVVASVRDTGSGIPGGIQNGNLRPILRYEACRQRCRAGTGNLVLDMIEVRSKAGAQSTVDSQ